MEDKTYSIEEYNDIPVYYCKDCLSLRIREAPLLEYGYCDSCGSTRIGSTSIEEWEEIYNKKHKKHL